MTTIGGVYDRAPCAYLRATTFQLHIIGNDQDQIGGEIYLKVLPLRAEVYAHTESGL